MELLIDVRRTNGRIDKERRAFPFNQTFKQWKKKKKIQIILSLLSKQAIIKDTTHQPQNQIESIKETKVSEQKRII